MTPPKTVPVTAHIRRLPRKPEAYRAIHEQLEQDVLSDIGSLCCAELERVLEVEFLDRQREIY